MKVNGRRQGLSTITHWLIYFLSQDFFMLDFFQGGGGRVHLYSLVSFVLNSGRYNESQAEPSVIWSNASGLIAHQVI